MIFIIYFFSYLLLTIVFYLFSFSPATVVRRFFTFFSFFFAVISFVFHHHCFLQMWLRLIWPFLLFILLASALTPSLHSYFLLPSFFCLVSRNTCSVCFILLVVESCLVLTCVSSWPSLFNIFIFFIFFLFWF